MAEFHSNAIYWVDTGKIKPNPFQPRREFDQEKLNALADSIKQYGVLQPLVVTRQEEYRQDGGMVVGYELIAGERRLRASKIAEVAQVPVVIRSSEETDNVKLELAIIENLQREDLNPIDRALAFEKLAGFGYNNTEIGKKMGMSRAYVSNTLRLLKLPQEMRDAIQIGQMTEGHARPLLMLIDRPEEQQTLFKEIIYKKITVRDAEEISRRIAKDKARKHDRAFNPEVLAMEEQMSESLGTRVRINALQHGGKIVIEFNDDEDLHTLVARLQADILQQQGAVNQVVDVANNTSDVSQEATNDSVSGVPAAELGAEEHVVPTVTESLEIVPSTSETAETPAPVADDVDEDLYSVSNFSV